MTPKVEDYPERVIGAAHPQLGTDVEIMVDQGGPMVVRRAACRVVTVKCGDRIQVAVMGGLDDNLAASLHGTPFEDLMSPEPMLGAI
jgi:hypothetical protein